MNSITCENCGKCFRAKYSAEIHKLNCLDKSESLFTCECGKKFASKNTYYGHRRVCQDHIKNNLEPQNDALKYECQEGCLFKTKAQEEFLKHLKESHNINIERNQQVFNCYSEFEAWKDSQEKETDAQFLITHVYNTSRGKVKNFMCNRSGRYIPVTENRKRALKSQGSKKLGFKCTSSIKVLISNSSGAVDVTFIGHYGHKHQLRHLCIPASDREKIASELAEEVEYPRVLNNLFAENFTKLERKHIITKQDLKNISRKYGLPTVKKQSEDHIGVDIYVQENIQDVLLYKRQYEEEFHHPKMPAYPLENNDFMLCMMTAFQREMLMKFGGDIICCDDTHGINIYDFKIIAVLVFDEFREGVPVAWMISNRDTAVALTLFFKAIKDNLGAATLTPIIFMSDKAPQYYNSFQKVFASNAKKRLCHWHVLKDFNDNIHSKVKKDKQDKVYESLCELLEEPSIEVFKGLLDEFLDILSMNSDTQEFLEYFEREWLGIEEEWAKCFRIGAGINTDIFVEAFHKKLKQGESYLNGNQVDKCLSLLFDFSRDLNRNRIIQLQEGKTTKKVSEIKKRHKASFALSCSSLDLESPSSWTIKSKTPKYNVKKNKSCRRNCEASSTSISQSIAAEDPMNILIDIASTSERNNILNLKDNMKTKAMELFKLIDSCTDPQSLMLVNNSLDNAFSVLQLKRAPSKKKRK